MPRNMKIRSSVLVEPGTAEERDLPRLHGPRQWQGLHSRRRAVEYKRYDGVTHGGVVTGAGGKTRRSG